MTETPRRVRAKNAYIDLIKRGTVITPKEFAKRSTEFLGEDVAYETIRLWYREDGWSSSVIVDGFDASDELLRTREFMESAISVIENDEGAYTANDVASAAGEYRKMLRKLPEAFWPLVEEEILQVREELYKKYNRMKKQSSSHTILARLSGVWADLAKFVAEGEKVADEAIVVADSLILSQRS